MQDIPKTQVVCIGNAVLDIFLTLQNANQYCHYSKETNEICFRAGQKIPMEKSAIVLGGNACNVSVGLSRLGVGSSLCAEIGNDIFATQILAQLHKETVDTALVQQTPGASSSFSVGINFQRDRTLFVTHRTRDHAFDISHQQTDWVYLTSLGNKWEHVYEHVTVLAQKQQFRLALNPGTVQLEKGTASFLPLLQVVAILFVNKDEALRMTSQETNEQLAIADLLLRLQQLGPQIVVLTDGERGAYSIDNHGKILHCSAFPSTIVERTGAGDAYTSGFLAAYIQGLFLSEAMRWGAINAANVITHVGSQAGLLTKEQMREVIQKYDKLEIKEISRLTS